LESDGGVKLSVSRKSMVSLLRVVGIIAWIGAMVCCGMSDDEPAPAGPPWTSGLCNGYEELCDRRFDEVTFLMTHNAMSSLEDGWAAANQRYNVNTQLADGVRGFMLDTYDLDGVPYLCHGPCDLAIALCSRPSSTFAFSSKPILVK